MRQDCECIIAILESCAPYEWAELFVNHKMRFCLQYSVPLGLIFSCIHGIDFFDNILKCLDGAKWEPDKDEPQPGEYEENFRKFIKHYRKQYEQKH